MKHSLELFYSVHSGGDGSAYPKLMESADLATWDQEHQYEGWGEDCSGSFLVESDSPIRIVDDVKTRHAFLIDYLLNEDDDIDYEELDEDDDEYDSDSPNLHVFIKQFFPEGVPFYTVEPEDPTKKPDVFQQYLFKLDGVIVAKNYTGDVSKFTNLNKYHLKPKDNPSMKPAITADKVRDKILNAKGNFVNASWKSNPKPAAAHKGVLLEKHTVAVVQAGVNFANLSAVKQGIADGTRDEVGELPWGEWYVDPLTKKSWFPHVISHKDELYLRLYPSGAENHIPKSVFFVEGKEVTKDVYASYLTPSEAKKVLNPTAEDKPLCFTIKLNNLLDIPQDV